MSHSRAKWGAARKGGYAAEDEAERPELATAQHNGAIEKRVHLYGPPPTLFDRGHVIPVMVEDSWDGRVGMPLALRVLNTPILEFELDRVLALR